MTDAAARAASPPALETNTQLAVERTRLAYERTMMAWIRTSTALISFGFTIYKFFDFASAKNPAPDHRSLITPRHFAMIMIAVGLVALALSALDHHRQLRNLTHGSNLAVVSTAGIVAALISIMGVLAFATVLLRA